jgi:GR25 family glycosyltransferase involved in LPS biosynthesis
LPEDIAVKVLNLASSPNRWQRVRKRLTEAGFANFERVEAIDGMTHTWSPQEAHLFRDCSYDPQVKRGMAGCSLTHLSLWRALLQSSAPHMAIMEDDVVLAPRAHERLQAILQWLVKNGLQWDLVWLSAAWLKEAGLVPGQDLPEFQARTGHPLVGAWREGGPGDPQVGQSRVVGTGNPHVSPFPRRGGKAGGQMPARGFQAQH